MRRALQEPPHLDLTRYGWSRDEETKSLQPPPTKLPALDYVLKLVSCSCASETLCSTSKCGCVAAYLTCTAFCRCEGSSIYKNEQTKAVEYGSREVQFLCILTFCSDWSEAGSEMVWRLSSDGREVHFGIGVGIGVRVGIRGEIGKPRRATYGGREGSLLGRRSSVAVGAQNKCCPAQNVAQNKCCKRSTKQNVALLGFPPPIPTPIPECTSQPSELSRHTISDPASDQSEQKVKMHKNCTSRLP